MGQRLAMFQGSGRPGGVIGTERPFSMAWKWLASASAVSGAGRRPQILFGARTDASKGDARAGEIEEYGVFLGLFRKTRLEHIADADHADDAPIVNDRDVAGSPLGHDLRHVSHRISWISGWRVGRRQFAEAHSEKGGAVTGDGQGEVALGDQAEQTTLVIPQEDRADFLGFH